MRVKAFAALIFAVSIASPAAAQEEPGDSDQGEVAVQGNVSPLCLLGAPSQAVVDLGNLINTSGTRVGKTRTIGTQTVTLPASFCNFAGSVATVEATALVEESGGVTAPPSGFSRAVNYTAVAGQWGGGSATATTAALASGASATASGASAVQPTPRQVDLTVALSGFSAPGDGLLVSGDYSGLVRITLGPSAVSE